MKPVAVALVLFSITSCGGGFGGPTAFYEVVRARSEECTIRSNGEFCVEPDQFDPPVTDVWSVALEGGADHARVLIVDDEVWILDPRDGSEREGTAERGSKRSVVTDGSSGCTTTRTRAVEFVVDGLILTGTASESSVLTGPPSCGDTPAGQRTVDTLNGTIGGP